MAIICPYCRSADTQTMLDLDHCLGCGQKFPHGTGAPTLVPPPEPAVVPEAVPEEPVPAEPVETTV